MNKILYAYHIKIILNEEVILQLGGIKVYLDKKRENTLWSVRDVSMTKTA